MQLKLPLFPTGTTLISDCLGVYEKESIVQYIVNGLPVYAHPKDMQMPNEPKDETRLTSLRILQTQFC